MQNKKQYVAFLRGINVGGNQQIKMEDLRKCFSDMGFTNIKSLLNSGNIIFESDIIDKEEIKTHIEEVIKETFGLNISILIRSISEIKELIDSEPFKGIKVTENIRLYVTFLSHKPDSTQKVLYETPEKDFKILRVTDSEVCCGLILSPSKNTTDLMANIEKRFGKHVTTRNWNTINRVLKLAVK